MSEVRYSSNSSLVEKYWYDANGQRVKKQNSVGEFTYYVNQFYEIENGTATSYFFRDDERIAKETSGDMEWYLSDHLGSTTLLVNESGLEVERTEYYPYGEVQSGGLEKYGFTGQENDADTGLMYYGARYYSPEYRVFVQPDTMLPDPYNPQALNRYAYCLNNPVKYNDPTGHHPVLVAAASVAMVALTLYSLHCFVQDTVAWNHYQMDTSEWTAKSALNLAPGVGGAALKLTKATKFSKAVKAGLASKGLRGGAIAAGGEFIATTDDFIVFIAMNGPLGVGSYAVDHIGSGVDSTIQENTVSGTRIGNALSYASSTSSSVSSYVSSTSSSVSSYVSSTSSSVSSYVSSTSSSVSSYVSSTSSSVSSYVNSTSSSISSYIDNVKNTVKSKINKWFS